MYLVPWTAYPILAVEITESYFDNRNEGYSMEKSAGAAAVSAVSSISPFQTGVFGVDQVSQAVFGSGFSITAVGLEQLVLGKEEPSGQDKIRNQQQFCNNVSGGLMVMGGLGSSRYNCYSSVGGDCYVRF